MLYVVECDDYSKQCTNVPTSKKQNLSLHFNQCILHARFSIFKKALISKLDWNVFKPNRNLLILILSRIFSSSLNLSAHFGSSLESHLHSSSVIERRKISIFFFLPDCEFLHSQRSRFCLHILEIPQTKRTKYFAKMIQMSLKTEMIHMIQILNYSNDSTFSSDSNNSNEL